MFKTKKHLLLLTSFFTMIILLGLSVKITLPYCLISCASVFIVISLGYRKNVIKNQNQLKNDQDIEWIDVTHPVYKKYSYLWMDNQMNEIEIGLLKNQDINAYAWEDINEKHKIMLSIHMLDSFNKQEMEAVILHELGHLKNKHISKRMLFSELAHTFIFILLIAAMIKISNQSNIMISIITLLFIASPFIRLANFLIFFTERFYSRMCEYEADGLAISYQGSPIHIMKVLTKLESTDKEESLWKRFKNKIQSTQPDWLHTHPQIDKRLHNAEKFIFLKR